jgi:hypothetical protein
MRKKAMNIVLIRHKAATDEDAADWEALVRALVNYKACELAIVL